MEINKISDLKIFKRKNKKLESDKQQKKYIKLDLN